MSGIRTISPLGMTVKDWTDANHIELERFGSIPVLLNDELWKAWGATICLLASLSGIIIPSPYEFDQWQDWAERFNEILSTRT